MNNYRIVCQWMHYSAAIFRPGENKKDCLLRNWKKSSRAEQSWRSSIQTFTEKKEQEEESSITIILLYRFPIVGKYWLMYIRGKTGKKQIQASSNLWAIATKERYPHLSAVMRLSPAFMFSLNAWNDSRVVKKVLEKAPQKCPISPALLTVFENHSISLIFSCLFM